MEIALLLLIKEINYLVGEEMIVVKLVNSHLLRLLDSH